MLRIAVMPSNRKRLWFIVKLLVALTVIALAGVHFARILAKPELHPYPFALRIEYLVPCGLLYLLAHALWGGFWVRLLRSQGVRVSLPVGLRAYFFSQFGKYVPGKALVILIRVAMLRTAVGGKPLPVAITATYETLTSMAAGAIIGVALLPWVGVVPDVVSRNLGLVVAAAALPLVLGLLNKVAARRLAKWRGPDAPPLPSPPLGLLVQGLLQGACGWCLLGVSLALAVQAVAPVPPAWTGPSYLADLGAIALAYVSGFFMLFVPGGLGVRELILEFALKPRFAPESGATLAAAQAVVIALVLRMTWLASEAVCAVGLYLWQPQSSGPDESAAPEEADTPSNALSRGGPV
jgi:uncharacterized membrane protein YbhN (UPF0104 family)